MNFYILLNKYKKKILSLTIIIFILVFANRLLLQNTVYESDDYRIHAVRIANYYLALKQGIFPVRWGPNLNGGLGYPAFNYMYHTPYILGSVLHITGLSIPQSLNVSVLLALLLGATGCYFFVNSYLKSEVWKILLTLFFIINPYTMLNVYWRGAIGELFFYAFIPFFLLSVKKLLKNYSTQYFILTVASFFLLVISHIPSLLLLFIVLFVFIITEIKNKSQFKNVFSIIYACSFGILLSAWYWMPAFFEQWMIVYQTVGSLTQYTTQFINLFSLFEIQKNINTSALFPEVLQIGGISVLAIIIGILAKRIYKETLPWLILLFTSIFFLSNYSKIIWDVLPPLQYLQFPWRFSWVIVLTSIFILISFISETKVKQIWKQILALSCVIILIFTASGYIKSKGTTNRSDFDWYHPALETGSSFNEHLPIWANTYYYFPNELVFVTASESAALKPETFPVLIHNLSEIDSTIIDFDGKVISYILKTNVDIIVLHKRLFYPGWEATLDGKPIEFITNTPGYEGILALPITNNDSEVKIEFTGYTTIRRFSEILSISSVIFLIGYATIRKYRIKQS